MKKIKVARVVWIVCLFLFLIVVLLMVMDYKINYQYLSHNYLYFYECDGELCVTSVKDNQKLLYSSYDCGYLDCPIYKRSISDSYALLNEENRVLLYQYRDGNVISDSYDNYEMIDNKYIIVQKSNLYGIIDVSGKEIVKPIYEDMGLHNNGYLLGYGVNGIIAMKNGKYGIISYKDGKMLEDFKYTNEMIDTLLDLLKE